MASLELFVFARGMRFTENDEPSKAVAVVGLEWRAKETMSVAECVIYSRGEGQCSRQFDERVKAMDVPQVVCGLCH